MDESRPAFRSGVVRPVECLKEGWHLIRENYWLFFGISVLGVLIASFAPMYILLGPMMCGIFYCLLRRSRGKLTKFEMLFKGFDYFVQSLIATLIMLVPLVILVMIGIALYIVGIVILVGQGGGPPNPAMLTTFFIGLAVFVLLVAVAEVLISVLFFFTFPLIVDKKLTGVQALGTSIRAARANLGGVLGLVLLFMLLGLLGALVCVGGYFLLPIHFAAVAVAYKRVFDWDDEEPFEDDGVSLEPSGH